MKNAR